MLGPQCAEIRSSAMFVYILRHLFTCDVMRSLTCRHVYLHHVTMTSEGRCGGAIPVPLYFGFPSALFLCTNMAGRTKERDFLV